jgi:cytochrome c biogenesis protein
MKFEGLTIYQTDWNIIILRVTLNDEKELNIPLREITAGNNSRFWIGSLGDENKILIVLQDLTGKYLVYNSEKQLLGEGQIGHRIFFSGNEIRINAVVPSTGLQIKSDPGIPLVYIGFLFLIFSVMLSYVSYFQIWAVKKQNRMYVYGDTNRAVYFFEKAIMEMVNDLQTNDAKSKLIN